MVIVVHTSTDHEIYFQVVTDTRTAPRVGSRVNIIKCLVAVRVLSTCVLAVVLTSELPPSWCLAAA